MERAGPPRWVQAAQFGDQLAGWKSLQELQAQLDAERRRAVQASFVRECSAGRLERYIHTMKKDTTRAGRARNRRPRKAQ